MLKEFSNLIDGLNALQDKNNLCFNKLYSKSSGKLVAERVAGQCRLIDSEDYIDFDEEFYAKSSFICRDDILEGDLLALKNGLEMRVCYDDVDGNTLTLKLETNNVSKEFNNYSPSLFSWKSDFSYGVNDYLDVIHVKRGDEILKTPMYDKHYSLKKGDKVTVENYDTELAGHLLEMYKIKGYFEVKRIITEDVIEVTDGNMSILIEVSILNKL